MNDKIRQKNVKTANCFGNGAHDWSNRFKASTPTDGAAFKTDCAYTQRKQNITNKKCNEYDDNSSINNAKAIFSG